MSKIYDFSLVVQLLWWIIKKDLPIVNVIRSVKEMTPLFLFYYLYEGTSVDHYSIHHILHNLHIVNHNLHIVEKA